MEALKIGFLIAASIAGAGFASGKEIMMFFTRYQSIGVWGLVFCAVLLLFFTYIGMKLAYNLKVSRLKEFLDYNFGKYGHIFQCMIVSFMFVVYSVMVCGAGEMISLYTGLNYYMSSLVFIFIVVLTTGRGSEFVQKIAISLMGILFIAIIIFCIFINIQNACGAYQNVFALAGSSKRNNLLFAFWEALTYCGYNALLATNSMIDIAKGLKKTKLIFLGSLSATLIFIFPAFLMNSAMIPFVKILEIKPFPFIFLLDLINANLGNIYAFIVFLAMILSAMMNGYFLKKLHPSLPFLGFLFVFTGFSEIIGRIYPVFGIAGGMFLTILFIRYFMIYFGIGAIPNEKRVRGG